MRVQTDKAEHARQVKNYLRQVGHSKELLANLLRERDELREIAESIGSPTLEGRVQTSQSHEAAFVHKLDRVFQMEENIDAEIDRISTLSVDVNSRIERLPSYDERLVVRYRYLEGQPWDAIADRMCVSVRTAHRIHASALAHLEVPKENKS